MSGDRKHHSGRDSHPPPLPPGLLERYKRAFIPSHYTPFAIQTAEQQLRRSWFTETRPGVYLTDEKIAAHLEGRYWVASVPKVHTRALVVDLDEGAGLERRAEKVRQAFPEVEPLAFSTPRRGIHFDLMLEAPCWSNRVTRFAKDRLAAVGVELAPGKVEVYPSGKSAIRAPLGRDCYLLDPQSLEPVSFDREENLWTLGELLRTERYDRLEIPAEYGAAELPAKASRRRLRQAGGGEFMLEVDRLLRAGLSGPGERNQAFLKLCWWFHVIERLTGPAVEAELWGWIQTHHNEQSREFNRNPQAVYRKVQAVVKAFRPGEVGAGRAGGLKAYRGSKRPLEASRKAREGLEGLIGGYLEALPLDERERRFLGRVLALAHKWGIESLDRAELEVEIPSRTLQTFDRQYGRILPLLEAQGYMCRTRNYGAQIGRCCAYRVAYLDRGNDPA